MKYFFLSIFSSAVLLYGLSFLYGLAGTTVISSLHEPSIGGVLAAEKVTPFAPIALVLIIAGLGFKIAAVPFHFYAPDVYEGATNGNAGLLAVAPKIGGLAALVRLIVVAMPNTAGLSWQILLVISIASMTLGNVCALWQTNLRRLMAFSSIAHAGYLLIGIVVAIGVGGNAAGNGIGAATLYVIVYTLASSGVFAALAYLGGTQHEVSGVNDLSGLAKAHPLTAAVLAICLISLAGIPPLAGFWGKLTLFSGAIQAAAGLDAGVWFGVMAAAGAINAAIGVAYYLRVIAVMYFGVPKREFGCEGGWGAQLAMFAAAILVIAVGIFPGSVIQSTNRAEKSVERVDRARQVTATSPPASLARQ
jgi:NADH-quinone oxidoreductase subunit N